MITDFTAQHRQEIRLGEVPKGVWMFDKGLRFCVDLPTLGRIELFSGEYVVYNKEWQVIDAGIKYRADRLTGSRIVL